MRRRVIVGGAAAIAVALAWHQSPASAHHPEVVAENACVEGVPSIEVTATAWETDLGDERRINKDIRIDATGPNTSESVSGVFVSPDYEARVVFEVPNAIGDTVIVRATAVAPWGPNGEFGFAGTWRETWVTVADVCPPLDGTFGNEERPGVSTPPPVNEAPPSAPSPITDGEGAVTPTSVEVMGASVIRVPAQVSDAENGPRQLAFTGDHTATMAAAGIVALATGASMLAWDRRRLLTEER
jgi:hypothetical protein